MEAAFNFAFWLVRARPDAEDIVQEAYLRAFRAFDGFRGGDIRPWLLAIVRNTAYRWLSNRRRSGTVISLEEAFADGSGQSADDIASDEPTAEERRMVAAERDFLFRVWAGWPRPFGGGLLLRAITGRSTAL